MKHVVELANIHHILDIVESNIDLACIKKDRATQLIIQLRLVISHTFHELELLEQ